LCLAPPKHVRGSCHSKGSSSAFEHGSLTGLSKNPCGVARWVRRIQDLGYRDGVCGGHPAAILYWTLREGVYMHVLHQSRFPAMLQKSDSPPEKSASRSHQDLRAHDGKTRKPPSLQDPNGRVPYSNSTRMDARSRSRARSSVLSEIRFCCPATVESRARCGNGVLRAYSPEPYMPCPDSGSPLRRRRNSKEATIISLSGSQKANAAPSLCL